ncbi:tetratricopeptide repeat protein [Planktothrix agardhii]|uniref:tetratricopeptide repeat protein n=1 Tax=Planktothrix agardhii TaxID=1160 RepID=UPI001D0BA515|nr:tetratricopeptide repeat protein [Planktothrix agardhii]MCB8764119.1 tetratricopeptide repeat protein [Planktothrix agardhii 1809]MCB8766668.1 tetratricopeptide repeat protein [Planktothrix agardhii 1809]MCB8782175.1 tetratricopeptide repeat protein [Planktothrix agardhii 1808]MCF3566796.1 tetratricopeptide repeat protein [Planktothrix agardhii 1807]
MLPNEIRARSVQFLHQQTEIYINQGQFEDAIKACNQLLQIQSDYAPGYKLMADIFQRQGKLQDAQEWYTRTLELQPNWPEVHANLGSLYAKSQQWQQAIACYQKAVTLKPDFTGAYRNLAKVWTQLNQPQKSAQALYQAFKLEPNQATAEEHFNLGQQLAQQGATTEAQICYRNAIALDPNLTPAHQSLANLLKDQGKAQEATQVYRKAIEFNTPTLGAPAPSDTLAAATARDLSPQETLAGATRQQTVSHNTKTPMNHPGNPQTYLKQAQAYCALKEWDQAIATCQKALKLQPDLAEAYKIQGNALQILGEMSAAIRCYSKALEIQPQYPEVYANLGSLYAQEERLEKAASYYQQAVSLKPDFAGVYRNYAKVLTQMGQLESASQCLEKAYSLEPEKATAEEHFNLGNTRFKQGRFDEAIASYQKALQLNPQLAGVYYQLGQLYQAQGEIESAISAYQKALELEPSRLEFYYGFADLFGYQERWDDAIRVYNKILELDPNQSVAYYKIGEIFNRQWRLEEAINIYKNSISLNPKLVSSYYGLGKVLVKQESWQEAVQVLRQAVQMNPSGDAESYKGFGDALAKVGEAESAIKAYQKSTELDHSQAEVYQKLGDLLRDQEQLESAITAYQRSIELNPSVFWTQNNLADIFFKQERWEAAISAYQNAIALDSSYSWSYNSLADALVNLEQLEAAIPAYQNAIKLNPEFPWSYYNLGKVLTELENWEEAVVAYRGAIKVQSDLPSIQEKLADALRNRAKLDLQESLDYYYQVIQENPDHVAAYHKAIEIKPDDPQLYIQLANTLVNHDHLDGAIVFYQMALQLEPEHLEASGKLQQIIEKKNPLSQPEPTPSVIAAAKKQYREVEGYDNWLSKNTLQPHDLQGRITHLKTLRYQPKISVLLSLKGTPELFVREAIKSVIDQIYPHWELCIIGEVEDERHVNSLIEEYNIPEQKIKRDYRPENKSICANLNSGLELATGDFIALLKAEDLLTVEALYEVVVFLNQYPEADMVYSDQDRFNPTGKRTQPFFKPDWCPDTFLSRMYTGHLGVYRRQLVNKIGGFRDGYEGSYDYDLVLRLTEKTNAIFHIPKVLYSSRTALPFAHDVVGKRQAELEKANTKALEDALKRRGEEGKVECAEHPGIYRIRYQIQEYKPVSIIIPTRNLGTILNRCLESIFQKSTYPNYEVIVIDNGSNESETLSLLKSWQQKEPNRFKCYRLDIPFNFSQLNNYAVAQAKGDYLLFLNNDTEVINSDWIEAMVEQAQRPSIGAVGALLIYPDQTIQHSGVIIGLRSVADHAHRHFAPNDPGYYGQIQSINNYSSVTAACLMCRREVFEKIGGFDEQLAVAFNDVDLCLEMQRRGYHNIYLPHVMLYHHESKSRGVEDTAEKQGRFMQELTTMRQRWAKVIDYDPCYNPNLNRERDDYSLRILTDVEIVSVTRIEEDAEAFWGVAIDAPVPGLHKGINTVRFAGWIIGQPIPMMGVQILGHEGQVIENIPARLPRPDVAEIYPDTPNADSSGFWAEIEVTRILNEPELLLIGVFEDGSYAGIAKVQLRRPS